MIVFSILLTASLLAGFAFYRIARGNAAEITFPQEVSANTSPVDLEAFTNLLDPREDAFLREAIPQERYEVLRRMRIRAAIGYLEEVARNAAVIIRLAQTLGKEPIAESAPIPSQDVVNDALRLRVLCKLAIFRLRWEFFFPAGWGKLVMLADDYRKLADKTADLVRLREPALAHQVLSALQA